MNATATRKPTRGKKAKKQYCTCPICFHVQTPNGVYYCSDDREHAAYDNGVYITAGTLLEAENALNTHRYQALAHTGNFDFSFAAAVAAADLDAEIAAYKADLASEAARPDYIVYSRIRGGFVYGSESGVYDSNTAADIARSAPPTPSPMPGPGDFDTDDSALCANCSGPAHEWCDECDLDVCVTCSPRFHRHGQPASPRRNGTAFFDRQRAARAARADIIEAYFYNARAAAAELHGDLGDAAYSERVQAEADALFN